MINLFKSKKVSISLQILLMMESYLKEIKSEISTINTKEKIQDLRKEYNKLLQLGLGNTKNAKLIKEKYQQLEFSIDCYEYIKRFKNHFGEKSFIISYRDFYYLLKKYNLVYGQLKDYTGIIPNENLRDIIEAKNKTYRFSDDSNLCVFNVSSISDLFHTLSFEESNKVIESLRKYLEKRNNLIFQENTFETTTTLDDLIKYNDLSEYKDILNYPQKKMIILEGQKLQCDEFLIACPPSQLKPQELRVTKKTIDPIVFQFCDYGVKGYTIWGEESEDIIFKEYKKLNKLLI